jgi:hypothetical protein
VAVDFEPFGLESSSKRLAKMTDSELIRQGKADKEPIRKCAALASVRLQARSLSLNSKGAGNS